MITADEVSRGKPHPEPYLKTIEKLQLKPSECVVIEDSVNGVRSAKRAGAKCIAVTTSFRKHDLREADATVDRLKEITEDMFHTLNKDVRSRENVVR